MIVEFLYFVGLERVVFDLMDGYFTLLSAQSPQ